MNVRPLPLIFCWVSMILATSLSADETPAQGQFSDATKTFSVAAAEPWTRKIEIERAKPTIVLALADGDAKDGHLAPTITIMEIPDRGGKQSNLDATAESLLQKARSTHPDQGSNGKIARIKLDGADARSLEYILEQAGNVVHFKTLLASHGGKLYVIQFFCSEPNFASHAGSGGKVLNSFHWSPDK